MEDKIIDLDCPRAPWEIPELKPIVTDENASPQSPFLAQPITDKFEIAVEIAAWSLKTGMKMWDKSNDKLQMIGMDCLDLAAGLLTEVSGFDEESNELVENYFFNIQKIEETIASAKKKNRKADFALKLLFEQTYSRPDLPQSLKDYIFQWKDNPCEPQGARTGNDRNLQTKTRVLGHAVCNVIAYTEFNPYKNETSQNKTACDAVRAAFKSLNSRAVAPSIDTIETAYEAVRQS